MKKEELTELADDLLHMAIIKCDSLEEAQDLTQSTLLEGLMAIRKGIEVEHAKSWLITVLNRKYYDLLRVKYRKPLVFYGMAEDIEQAMEVSNISVDMANPEWQCCRDTTEMTDEENLRRLVAGLTKLYREVLVRHYFHGRGIKEIAKELSLPENTVKSRLRLGRDKLRKELTMEKYEKQSYEPENLWISSSGNPGMDDQPYSLVKNDKIIMNLLILAYEKPVTVPELADAIGISTTYIEPIVERLVDGELMKQSGDKVYTDFIIYTEQDRLNTFEIQKDLATKKCNDIWKYVEYGLNILRNQKYYKGQNGSQTAKLEGYFVLRTVYNSVLKVRDEIAGHTSFEDYPYRKDGGRWFAMGHRFPTDYNHGKCPYSLYETSGEAVSGFNNWSGAKWVALFDYDTDEKVLGKSHSAYRCAGNFGEAREGVTKLLYAIYREDERFLSGISQKVLESIDDFLKLDFLERTEDGKLQLNVPVLNMEEKKAFYELMEEYSTKLSEIFHDDYAKMIQNPVAVPKQIRQDVPGFLRYLNTCCYFPSAFIYELRKKGLFLKGYEKPAPAVFMEIEVNGE